MSKILDDYLSLAGFSSEFRMGFYLGRTGSIPMQSATEDTMQGYRVGIQYVNKPEAYALNELQRLYAIDPVGAEFMRFQAEQHRKGLETYHISLYHADLPIEELLEHTVRELVDASNYLIATLLKMKRMKNEAQP